MLSDIAKDYAMWGARVSIITMLFLLPVACKSPAPDSRVLYQTAVIAVFDDTPDMSGWTLVLDSENISRLPPLFAALLQERASKIYDQALVSHVDENPDNLPGIWKDGVGSSSFRKNTTHLLLLVNLVTHGDIATLNWELLCGELCGFGKTMELSWNGREWTKRVVGDRMY